MQFNYTMKSGSTLIISLQDHFDRFEIVVNTVIKGISGKSIPATRGLPSMPAPAAQAMQEIII